ncbi:MAG: HNH endonuclease, partial [Paeniglutamicibacter sp.]
MGTTLSMPRTGQMSTADLGQQLAAAALALSAATGQLALVPLDAAGAAAMMGLLERSHRAIAYAQLLITRRAGEAEVHRLDPVTAQRIDQLVAQPGPLADGTAGIPPEELRQGMAPHRNTQAYMQAHLH